MSDHLEASIKRYLRSQNDPHLVLIAGDWGCGKTHFAQTRIKEIAAEVGKETIYLSLFGIENKEDFERSLLVRQLPVNEKVTKLAFLGWKLVKGSQTVDARGILSIWNGISEKTLLIIDDLERVENVSAITSILGIVNNLVYEKSAKAIVIGNEDAILRSDTAAKYSSWKEKSIRYTYKYQIDSETIRTIVANELAKFNSGLIELNRAGELIEKVVEVSSCFNLRTYLRSIAQLFQFAEILRSEIIFSDAAAYDLLLTICAINIEYSSDPGIKNALAEVFTDTNYLELFTGGARESEMSRKFLAKYFGPKHRGFTRIPQVFHAVIDGVWNEDSIRGAFENEYRKDKSAIGKLLLSDFRVLSDSEFRVATQELIERVRQRQFNNAVELLKAGNLLFYFAENNLVAVPAGELKSLLEYCLDDLPLTAFMFELSSSDYSLVLGGAARYHGEDHRAFMEYFKDKWNHYYRDKLERKKLELIRGMSINLEPLVNAIFTTSSEIARQTVFNKSDAIAIVENLKIMTGSEVMRFSDAIMYRYKAKDGVPPQFSGEVEFMETMRDALQKHLFSSSEKTEVVVEGSPTIVERSLSEFEIRDFYEKLDEFLKAKTVKT